MNNILTLYKTMANRLGILMKTALFVLFENCFFISQGSISYIKEIKIKLLICIYITYDLIYILLREHFWHFYVYSLNLKWIVDTTSIKTQT